MTDLESEIAQALYNMLVEYQPRLEDRMVTWQELPLGAYPVWHERARRIILRVSRRCPFSIDYQEGK